MRTEDIVSRYLGTRYVSRNSRMHASSTQRSLNSAPLSCARLTHTRDGVPEPTLQTTLPDSSASLCNTLSRRAKARLTGYWAASTHCLLSVLRACFGISAPSDAALPVSRSRTTKARMGDKSKVPPMGGMRPRNRLRYGSQIVDSGCTRNGGACGNLHSHT